MALHDLVTKGSVDRSVTLRIIDSTDGTPETGVVFNTSGIDLWYRRESSALVSITEATLAALTTAHADGGFLHIANGEYRLDLPDAAFATGANHVDFGGTVTGMVVIGGRVRLVDYSLEDGVRMGLTALPNAAAEAAGGLYTRGTGAGQINQPANGVVDTNTKTWNALTTVALPLVPTTAGRTLDVSTGGEAGLDWANIGSPTTAVNLSATNIDVDQVVASVSGAVGSVTGAVGSVTGNVGGDVTGSVGTVNALAANVITAAATATDFGTEVGTAVWATTTRVLTAGTNLNDLNAAGVRTAVGLASANLDIQLAAIDDFIDTEVAAIFSRIGAPVGASISADIAAVKTDTAAVKVSTDKLDDTVELTSDAVYVFTADALANAPTGGGSAPTAAAIADAVWNEAIADHSGVAGSTAEALNAAGSAGDPWVTALPGAYSAGQAGFIVGTNLDATVGTRATQSSVNTIDDFLDTEIADIQSRLPTTLVSGRIDASVGAMAANVMTAAAAASDLTTELQSGLATASALSTVAGNVTSIKASTDNLPGDPADQSLVIAATSAIFDRIGAPVGASVSADVAAVKADTAAVLLDTGTDGVVVASASKTGYRLSSAGVDDVLRTALTEGYAADGATFTLEQALYMLWSLLAERSIAATTLTAKKLDGSTAAMTFTLDDATTPTAQTRAT